MKHKKETTPEQVEEKFNKLKKDGEWGSLGNMFFHLFVTLEKGNPTRDKASELWNSLTEEEQNACEDCA